MFHIKDEQSPTVSLILLHLKMAMPYFQQERTFCSVKSAPRPSHAVGMLGAAESHIGTRERDREREREKKSVRVSEWVSGRVNEWAMSWNWVLLSPFCWAVWLARKMFQDQSSAVKISFTAGWRQLCWSGLGSSRFQWCFDDGNFAWFPHFSNVAVSDMASYFLSNR